MKRIHNSKERMPLIIPRAAEGIWLDEDLKGDDAAFLVRPYAAGDILAHPVTKELHNPNVNPDREESLTKVEYDQFFQFAALKTCGITARRKGPQLHSFNLGSLG